jgi:hypothetical protein
MLPQLTGLFQQGPAAKSQKYGWVDVQHVFGGVADVKQWFVSPEGQAEVTPLHVSTVEQSVPAEKHPPPAHTTSGEGHMHDPLTQE